MKVVESLVSEDIITEVLLQSSSPLREEPGSRPGVDGLQGERGRKLEGASPLKSPLNPRCHIGGSVATSSSRFYDDNGDMIWYESSKAAVVGGDAEENVTTSLQRKVEPAMTGTTVIRTM